MATLVAILYRRNAQPDEQVLKALESELIAHGHRVFIDRHMTIGVEWAREIERQVRSADAVIPLISAASVSSEMLAYEIQIAHEAAQQQQGKPRLLPVRIDYEGPLPDPRVAIINPSSTILFVGFAVHRPLTTLHCLNGPHRHPCTISPGRQFGTAASTRTVWAGYRCGPGPS